MKNFLLLLFVATVQCSFAQDNSFELNEIQVIEGTPLAQPEDETLSFDEVSKEEIENIQPDSLDDVLSSTPGATTIGGPRSSSEAPQIRGLDSNKIFIYIDNIKQTIRSDHSTMVMLDPEHLKSVKVYKSPAASIKGTSLGGGVVLVTKDAEDYLASGESLGSEFKIGYQNSSQEKNGSAKLYGKGKKLQGLISVSRKEAKDLKLSDGQTLPRSSYKDSSLSSRFTYKKNKSEKIKVSVDIFNRKDDVPLNPAFNPPVSAKSFQGNSDIDNYSYSLNYKNNSQSNDNLNLEVSFYSTNQNILKTRESDSREDERSVDTYGTSILNRIDLDKSGSFVVLGGELTIDKLDGRRNGEALASYPKGNNSLGSLFTHLNLKAGKLTVVPGLRYENYNLHAAKSSVADRCDEQVLKKVGVSYQLTKHLQLSVNSSEGYNAPRVQEVYMDGLHFPGSWILPDNYFVPNESLVPETSENLEMEAKFQSSLFNSEDLFTFGVQIFRTEAQNYIYKEVDYVEGTTKFINVPDAKLKGKEIFLDYIYDLFELHVAYSDIRGRNLTNDLWLAELPADKYTFKLQAEVLSGLTIGYEGILAEDQPRVNPQTGERTDPTDGYFIHNAFINKKINSGTLKDLEISTRFENIADKEYRKHASNIKEKGFDFKVGLKYKVTYF